MTSPGRNPGPSTLVVQYHPVRESLNQAVLEAVLRGAATDVEVFVLHHGEEPTPAALAAATTLVLVYPTWWGGLPGRLLQWVQNVFAPCYDGRPGSRSPVPQLRRLVAVTTHGSSALINRIQGDPGHGFLTRLAARCAPGARFEWYPMFGVGKSTEQARAEFIDGASAILAPGGER